MSQLKKGALLTYANVFLTNIIGLILTPFIIKSLGNSEYGLYTLVGSFISYLTLMNLGINNAIIRFVAKYRAENDKDGETTFLGTTFLVYIFISITLVLVGMGIYYNLDSLFKESLTSDELSKAKLMFLIFVANLAITVPGGAFQAICNGYEHFVFPRLLKIIRYIVRAICIVSFLMMGGKALSIVIIDSVLGILAILITAFYVFNKLNVKISLKNFDKGLIGEIFSYSIWVFLFGIVYKFQWSTGQIILGINNNTTIVAIYGVGVLLGGYYGAFAGGINSVLIPRATQMIVNKNDGELLTEAMIKIGRLITYILFLILSGFYLVGETFINLWVGETYKQSYIIAFLIMIVMTLPLIQAFGNSLLEANKKNRFKSLLSLFTVGFAMFFGFLFSKKTGINAVIYPLVTVMALNSLIMNWYYKKIFNFRVIYFFSNTILKPILFYTPLVVLFYYIITTYFEIDNWFKLITYALVYSVFYSLITYFFLMNDYEKALIKKNNK